MPSQLELLKRSVLSLEAKNKGGPTSPFVQGWKAQIAMLEKPRADNPMVSHSAGMCGAPMAPSASRGRTR
jgi:hypothetical protein